MSKYDRREEDQNDLQSDLDKDLEAHQDSDLFQRYKRWIEYLEMATRLMSSWFGLALIAVGIYIWWRIFMEVIGFFNDPQKLAPVYERWVQLIKGSDQTMITWEGGELDAAKPLAILMMVVLLLVIISLAIKLVKTGTDMIGWTLTDRLAIKKMIQKAYLQGRVRDIKAKKKLNTSSDE